MSDTKSTGIVRRLDDLGRIVLPKELRTVLGIAERDLLEIYVDKKNIILQKYVPDAPVCIFCSSGSRVTAYKNKHICKTCKAEISAHQ